MRLHFCSMKQVVLFLLLVVFNSSVWATGNPLSTKRIDGYVIDKASGESLTGVRVAIDGMPFVAVTDEKGYFSLDIPLDANAQLIFEFVSFEKLAVSFPNNGQSLEVAMAEMP